MSYFDDEEKIPVSQRLGNLSDSVFGFVFNPNTIKFGILLFAGACVFINISGYYDLTSQAFNYRVDEFGRSVALSAPLGVRVVSSITHIPVIGPLIRWLDIMTGGIMGFWFAIALWFAVQGLEIAGRFNLYFPQASENLLFKQNRKNYEKPNTNNPVARKAYRLATGHVSSVLRWIALVGIAVYFVDIYVMGLTRPWLDKVGNPLWMNWFWNSLAVFGVELAMLLYLAYKHMTLTPEEQTEKNSRP